MTRLIFVRHAQTINNVAPVLSSAAPGPPLTKVGEQQAREVGSLFAQEKVEAIYTSPLLRAVQTANEIAVHAGRRVIEHDHLRECGVGQLEGRGDEVAFTRYHQVWDQWLEGAGLDLELGPGGETGHEVLARMTAVVDQVRTERPDETVVLVSHGGLLQFALGRIISNIDPSWSAGRPVPNVGRIEVQAVPAGLYCVGWCTETPPTDQPIPSAPASTSSQDVVAQPAIAVELAN